MNLLALACRVPARSYTQREVWEAFSRSRAVAALRPGSREFLRRILLGDSGISRRHLACADPERLAAMDGGALNAVFEHEAAALATRALRGALRRAGIHARQLDALLVCTCTGYLCPGLSSHVAEQAGLRADAELVDSAGQGCGAALPLLRQAAATLAAGAALAACVAVEISSAAFYLDDDPGVLVSLCLFADGACAALWGGRGLAGQASVGGFQSLHWPERREELRFVNSGGKLKNVLTPAVPATAAEAVHRLWQEAAPAPGTALLVHPGGKKVLDAIESKLGLCAPESRRVLARHGNMSSPSILFVLAEWLRRGRGPRAWLAAFGAGFTCHAATLQRNPAP